MTRKKKAKRSDTRFRELIEAAGQARVSGRLEEAERLYREAAGQKPARSEALFFLGHFLAHTDRSQEAIAYFRRAARLAPDVPEISLELGLAYEDMGNLGQAETHFKDASRLAPMLMDAHLCLGNLYSRQGRHQEAATAYRHALDLRPGDPGTLLNLGHSLRCLGLTEEAARHYEAAANADPSFSAAHGSLAQLIQSSGRFEDALTHYRRGIEANPDDPSIHHGIATAYRDLGRVDEAAAHFRKADALSANPVSRAALASVLERAHRLDDARKAAEEALALDPRSAEARLILAKVSRRVEGEAAAMPLYEALIAGCQRGELHFSPAVLARAQADLAGLRETAGNVEDALNLYKAANDTNCASFPAWQEETRTYVSRVHVLTEAVRALPTDPGESAADHETQAPVFLVGFPRSGTTLLDQLLNAHPAIEVMEEKPVLDHVSAALGGAEATRPQAVLERDTTELGALRRHYFEEAATHCPDRGPGSILIDKLPLNILNLWLAAALFPGAKVVMALRDPRDVCLSCFTNLFRLGPGLAGFPSLESSADLYAAVMTLWLESRQRLNLSFHVVRYEDLIDDLETEARRLIAFLDLEWKEQVLDYRELARNRYIVTPSYHQVVRPLYGSARGRWRRFESALDPVIPKLQPFLEAFGYRT